MATEYPVPAAGRGLGTLHAPRHWPRCFRLGGVSPDGCPWGAGPGAQRRDYENQPATPVIESVRALLLDLPLEGHPWAALAWSGGILLVSVVLAGVFFARRTR